MNSKINTDTAMEKKSFKKMFPNLSKELEGEENKVKIDAVRTNSETAEKTFCDPLHNFNPTVVDFIRRCDTEDQAESIIAFLEKRSEITPKRATQLRTQLKKKGVRSFGPKKEDNYYFNHSSH